MYKDVHWGGAFHKIESARCVACVSNSNCLLRGFQVCMLKSEFGSQEASAGKYFHNWDCKIFFAGFSPSGKTLSAVTAATHP